MNGINSKDRFSFAKGYRARTIFLIFDILLLGILMCMMVLPLLKVIVDSIDPTSYGVRLWPRKIDFSAYEMILTTSSLYRPFLVSVLTTVVGTVTGLFIITMGAYVLIQKDMPGHVLMGRMVLFTMMFSGGMIPTYLVVQKAGLVNTLWSMIIPQVIWTQYLIILKNFMENIPSELLDSARIDGAGEFRSFLQIVLPLCKPILVTIAIYYGVQHWNEFQQAILYITKPDKWPLQVVVRNILTANQQVVDADQVVPTMTLQMASVVTASLPIVALYPFLQRFYVSGITTGAVKG